MSLKCPLLMIIYLKKVQILLDVKSHLKEMVFIEESKLVRGLDYYSHTAFEFQTNEDKRQNTILAGGRTINL